MTTWRKVWAREYGLHLMEAAVLSLVQPHVLQPYTFKEVLVIPEGSLEAIYVPEKEWEAYNQALHDRYLANIANFEDFSAMYVKQAQKLVADCQSLSTALDLCSNGELVEKLRQFKERLTLYNSYLWLSFLLNEQMGEDIKKVLQETHLSPSEQEQVLQYATTPSQLASTFLLNAEAKKYPLDVLTEKFAWITTLDLNDAPATQEDIASRLNTVTLIQSEEPLAVKNLTTSVQRLIGASREMAYLKDRRDDFRRQMTCAVLPIVQKLTQRVGIPSKLLHLATLEEIAHFDQKIQLRLEQRMQQGFAIRVEDGAIILLDVREEIASLIKQIVPQKGEQVPHVVRGIIGCKGRAQGEIKIILQVADLSKIEEGDVLCAVTTNPDYLPAMHKAAAFVTDEGGITCHVAIVARELEKPCLVGTKQATAIFKDGQRVEVDANKGIVFLL